MTRRSLWEGNETHPDFMEPISNAVSDSKTAQSPGDFATMPYVEKAASDSENSIWTPIVKPPHRFQAHWSKDNCCGVCGLGLEDHKAASETNAVTQTVTPRPQLTATIHKLNSAYSCLLLKVDDEEVRILLTPTEFEQLVAAGVEIVEGNL